MPVKGLVDAVIGGGGLAVEAVGVAAEQDGDAVARRGGRPRREGRRRCATGTRRRFAGSRSRTASRLKADTCLDAARRLQAAGITCIPDLIQHADDPEVRRAWTGVHGLAWVTWQYLCSPAGIDHLKPDAMLTRFVSETLGRHASPAGTNAPLTRVLDALLPDHPGLTKRALDHTIWRFQRDQ